MLQRSFRLSDDDLAALGTIAEHLATLDKRAPNQTRALAWSIARAMDAIAATDAASEKIPADIAHELADEAARLKRISDKRRATQIALTRYGYENEGTTKADPAEVAVHHGRTEGRRAE